MTRNFDKRIELLFPVLQEDCKAQLKDSLDLYLADNCQARTLESSGKWTALRPAADEKTCRAQDVFLAKAKAEAEQYKRAQSDFLVRSAEQI